MGDPSGTGYCPFPGTGVPWIIKVSNWPGEPTVALDPEYTFSPDANTTVPTGASSPSIIIAGQSTLIGIRGISGSTAMTGTMQSISAITTIA